MSGSTDDYFYKYIVYVIVHLIRIATCHFLRAIAISQQTQGIQPMLFQCCASVEDGGPTLKRHWMNDPCLLG